MAVHHPRHLATRVLVVTPAPPPLRTGEALILGRLFRDIDPSDVVVATTAEIGPSPWPGVQSATTVHRIMSGWVDREVAGTYRLEGVRVLRRFAVEVVERSKQLSAIMASEGIGAIYVTSGATPDLPAAFIAARRADKPLFVHMFDNWRHVVARDPSLKRIAAFVQWLVLRGARDVFVSNPWIARDVMRHHGVHPIVVANPIAEAALVSELTPRCWPRNDDSISVVFTGQIYAAHSDAFHRLISALSSHRLSSVFLDIFSDHIEDGALPERPGGRVRLHPAVPPDQVHLVQRRADILFLPLAFAAPYPQVIRSASPTKLGEYLCSGTPILIHAPPDSYLASLARQDGIGVLVDVPAPEQLVDAIEAIIQKDALRRGVVDRAMAVSRRSFAPHVSTETFVSRLAAQLASPHG